MSDDLVLFHVADIHGSDVCFRKWLNAGRFYGADVLVIGGDLTGKVLLPIVPVPGRPAWTVRWRDRDEILETEEEVAQLTRRARDEGAYAFRTTRDEVAAIEADVELERATFLRLKLAALAEWIALAETRLEGSRIRAYVMAGNDDPPEVDELLATSRALEDVQGRCVELAPGIVMASRGESTPTPWRTPRELDDDVLGTVVSDVLDGLPNGATTKVWNLHMPPHDTGIDRAPALDANLRVRFDGAGEAVMVPVGSRSILRLVDERQPALALHGHIHEGRGRYRRGRTLGLNPGSQYQDGVLQGVLVRLSARHGVRDATFTAG